MKKIIIAATLLLIAPQTTAQNTYGDKRREEHFRKMAKTNDDFFSPPVDTTIRLHHRYGLWPIPVRRSTVVDGMAVGMFASTFVKRDSLAINGISIEADPFPLVFALGLVFEVIIRSPDLLAQSHHLPGDTTSPAVLEKMRIRDSVVKSKNELRQRDKPVRIKIRGLSLSGGIIASATEVDGVAINAVCGIEKEMNGVEITGLANVHYRFRGIMMSLVNIVKTGRGVQVGIYNKCGDGKVLQIGLLNKNGKRTSLFVNFNFKQKKSAK